MRYAIYFTPPSNDPLTTVAGQWLGRDALSTVSLVQNHQSIDLMSPDERIALTADPKRYGFHATLKAPFELRQDKSESQLIDAFDEFVGDFQGFSIPEIVLGRLGAFFALVPGGFCPEIELLADRSVSLFEGFRAPLRESDIARRSPENLNESQRQNLMTWGYPYVFEDFRFHMSLTGPVAPDRRQIVQRALEARFAPFLGRPLRVDHLAIFVEPEPGSPFKVLKIAPLAEPIRFKSTG